MWKAFSLLERCCASRNLDLHALETIESFYHVALEPRDWRGNWYNIKLEFWQVMRHLSECRFTISYDMHSNYRAIPTISPNIGVIFPRVPRPTFHWVPCCGCTLHIQTELSSDQIRPQLSQLNNLELPVAWSCVTKTRSPVQNKFKRQKKVNVLLLLPVSSRIS